MVKINQEILYVTTDWDRSNCSLCNPCHISVNDFGSFQCTECLAIFGKSDAKLIQAFLLQRYGCEEAKKEYARLRQTKLIMDRGRKNRLRKIVYEFQKKDGTLKTYRYFFEASH